MDCLNPSNSFVAFALHLMKNIIGITNELSIALQKKKKNLSYSKCYGSCYSVKATITSDERWWMEVYIDWSVFILYNSWYSYLEHGWNICSWWERLWYNTQQNTNVHHYCVELLYTVIDLQLQELNNRFSEMNTDLLLCMACLNPSNSFVAFDKENLIRLAKFYSSYFFGTDILALDSQLQNYIFDICAVMTCF